MVFFWSYISVESSSLFLRYVYLSLIGVLLVTSLLSLLKERLTLSVYFAVLLLGIVVFLLLFSLFGVYFAPEKSKAVFFAVVGAGVLFSRSHILSRSPSFVKSFCYVTLIAVMFVPVVSLSSLAFSEKRANEEKMTEELHSVRLLVARGKSCEEKGDFRGARDSYERAVKLAPNDADAVLELVSYNERLGYENLARKVLEDSVAHASVDSLLLRRLVELYIKRKEYEEAARLVVKGVPVETEGEDAARLGKTLFFLKEYKLALEVFNGIKQGQVDEVELHYWRGRTLLALGRYEEGEREFETVLSKKFDFADAHYRFALIAKHRGDKATYEREVEETLKLSPDHFDALCEKGFYLKEPEGNLVRNWSFETKPDYIRDWAIRPPSSGFNTELDTKNAADGTHSLKIRFFGECPFYIHTEQIVKVAPNTRYKLSYLIMTDGLSGKMGVYIDVILTNKERRDIGFVSHSKEVLESPFWRLVETEFVAPADSTLVKLRIVRPGIFSNDKQREEKLEKYGNVTGTVWIDCVSVVPVK
jgi:tetratricopeptide (TPR) repeat protein